MHTGFVLEVPLWKRVWGTHDVYAHRRCQYFAVETSERLEVRISQRYQSRHE